MYYHNIMDMIGKEVEVMSSGMAYRGRLIEISETEVFLQGELGWVQLAIETVTDITPVSEL
jgi:hypothetical protein